MEKDRRPDWIARIEPLFPPDESPEGERLLWQALVMNWRYLPESVLISLMAMNEAKEAAR